MAPAAPVTTLNTPAGIPARSASSASARAEKGVGRAGLSTMVQPAARAGPALRVIMADGKFQGVMAATTPIGSLSTTIRLSAAMGGDGVAVDPLAFLREPLDEGGGVGDLAPGFGQRLALLGGHEDGQVFLVGHIRSYQRRRMAERSRAVRRPAGKRRLAASMARRVSAPPILGTVPEQPGVSGIGHGDRRSVVGADPLSINVAQAGGTGRCP